MEGISPQVDQVDLTTPSALQGACATQPDGILLGCDISHREMVGFEQSRTNAATCLEVAILGSLRELGNLVYRGTTAYPLLPAPTKVTLKVWVEARRRFQYPHQYSPFCPLWGNPSLSHFRMLPDPQLWARYGIKVLKDVVHAGTLLSF